MLIWDFRFSVTLTLSLLVILDIFIAIKMIYFNFSIIFILKLFLLYNICYFEVLLWYSVLEQKQLVIDSI